MRHSKRVAAAIAAFLVVGVGVWAVTGPLRHPTFTCSTPDTRACSNTEESMRWDKTWGGTFTFGYQLPTWPVAVDIRPAPVELNPREGDWAIHMTFEEREPVLALCYYSSDEMIACDLGDDIGAAHDRPGG